MKTPYAPKKIKDYEGNIFVLAYFDFGEFPVYRGQGGYIVIGDWNKYKILVP